MEELDLNRLKAVINNGENAMTLVGLNQVALEDGRLTITMPVEDKHLNMSGHCHGGIMYMICDQAVAAVDAAMGRNGVGIDGNMHYYRGASKGDVLKAVVINRKIGRKTGNHLVELYNQDGKLLADAIFTSFYTDK